MNTRQVRQIKLQGEGGTYQIERPLIPLANKWSDKDLQATAWALSIVQHYEVVFCCKEHHCICFWWYQACLTPFATHWWISCINKYAVMFFPDRWTPVTQTEEHIHTGYAHWSIKFAKLYWGTHTTKTLTSDPMTVWNIVLHFCHLQYLLLHVANYSHSAYVCCQRKNQWQSSPSPLVYWQKAAVIMASG